VLRPEVTARTAALRRDLPVSVDLDPFVERYWAVRWDRTGLPAFRTEILSHPSVNLSLEAGTVPRFGHPMPAVLLHGVVGRRFVLDLVGAGRVVAAKFRPGGFTALTGVAVPRTAVRPVTSAPWLQAGRAGADRALLASLACEDDAAVAARLDAALLCAAHEPDPTYLDLRAVLERMLADRSLVRVEQVAAVAGVAPRTLQRLFARYVGTGPKALLTLYRMQDAVAAIDAGQVGGADGGDLTALAADLGWFDHAHFCRDFREAVGTTPSAYLARAEAER
jgi:AraC-like DNA-binding protein